jgi:uncharacterized SAM-binding protein YcdF (DUF218 family)
VCVAVLLGLCGAAGQALIVSAAVERPDIILSLASHEWERLPAAASLARTHPGARVVLSVPLSVNQWNCHRCNERVPWLVRLGVARDRIDFLPRRVYRTLDEAVAARAYMRQHGLTRLLVVTSPYHTRRTWLTFRKVFDGAGMQIGVFPAVHTSAARPGRWWMYTYDRQYVPYEWAAILFYWWKFGVPWFTVS